MPSRSATYRSPSGVSTMRARAVHGRPGERSTLRSRACLRRSRVSLDDSGVEMQFADAVIGQIADQQIAVAIANDAVRLAKLGFGAGASVAAVAGHAACPRRLK